MRIIRVLPGIYNEIDILEENLRYYINQGFETVVVDNGSTDGSYELCKKYLGNGIIKLSRIITKEFDTRLLLKEATLLYKKVRPDWVILADADEFIEPFERNQNLRTAIEIENKCGNTIIPLHHFMFKMTEKDDMSNKSVLSRMKFYGKAKDADRAKIWKDSRHVEISNPHAPSFIDIKEYKPSNNKYVMRHYPLRTLEQAKAKINRVRPSLNNPFGWGIHYLGIDDVRSVVVKSNVMNYYNEDRKWKFDKHVDSDDTSDANIINYYLTSGRDYTEQYISQLKRINPAWEKNPAFLKRIGDIYLVINEKERAIDCYNEARANAEKIVVDIEELFEDA
jgi:glycosyltransferase involved in cell wall biosynthesis